jgi:hypothetical protein
MPENSLILQMYMNRSGLKWKTARQPHRLDSDLIGFYTERPPFHPVASSVTNILAE